MTTVKTRLEYLLYSLAVRDPDLLHDVETFAGHMVTSDTKAGDRARALAVEFAREQAVGSAPVPPVTGPGVFQEALRIYVGGRAEARAAKRPSRDIEETWDASRPFPDARCQACGPERYCGAHKYRWEYQQDERAAHEALDTMGAPRFEGPHSGDMRVLSVAGRIATLGEGRAT